MSKTYKIDLHTHSILSHDGGMSEKDYASVISSEKLHCIAITDHNEIDFAIQMNKKYPENIIIGEEIMTMQGEVIGLYLSEKIVPHQSVEKTIQKIKDQNGLVYIPHPFEIRRYGISKEVLMKIIDSVDIIEAFNARAFFPMSEKDIDTIIQNRCEKASSSDAHCSGGIGSAYSLIDQMPKAHTLCRLLSTGTLQSQRAPLWSYFCPKFNKIKKYIS